MWVELPGHWIVALNVIWIPLVQLAVSWGFARVAPGRFPPDGALFRERGWEGGGAFYKRFAAVRLWKGWLPDGAAWVGGFSKGRLRGRGRDYLEAFRVETCRGEAAHLAQVPAVLVALVWNPPPLAAGVIVAYAVASNLPCILVQRYTRHRLSRILGRPRPG